MTSKLAWTEARRSRQFKGLWVALDNCRFDQNTRQPMEGDVVDADEDLAELCGRMRETGQTACAILFCDDEVIVESVGGLEPATSARSDLTR